MRTLSALATALLAVTVASCTGDDSSPTAPPPPPPPPATIVGTWTGTQTVTSVTPPTQCVSYKYIDSRLHQAENVTAAFTANGSTVQLTYTFPFGTCTGSGTLSGTTFDVPITSCTPTEHRVSCQVNGVGNPVIRIASFLSMRVRGTADAGFTSITGTVNQTENTRATGGANTDPVSTVANLSVHK
jgi:hypothetical protein